MTETYDESTVVPGWFHRWGVVCTGCGGAVLVDHPARWWREFAETNERNGWPPPEAPPDLSDVELVVCWTCDVEMIPETLLW